MDSLLSSLSVHDVVVPHASFDTILGLSDSRAKSKAKELLKDDDDSNLLLLFRTQPLWGSYKTVFGEYGSSEWLRDLFVKQRTFSNPRQAATPPQTSQRIVLETQYRAYKQLPIVLVYTHVLASINELLQVFVEPEVSAVQDNRLLATTAEINTAIDDAQRAFQVFIAPLSFSATFEREDVPQQLFPDQRFDSVIMPDEKEQDEDEEEQDEDHGESLSGEPITSLGQAFQLLDDFVCENNALVQEITQLQGRHPIRDTTISLDWIVRYRRMESAFQSLVLD